MLKIHSFLHGIKESVQELTGRVRGIKGHMATVSYMMATVLFLISPNYLSDGNRLVEYVKAETAPAVGEVEEETANEAIVLTSHIAFSNMTNRVNALMTNDSIIYNNGGTLGSTTVSTENNEEETTADSGNDRADAIHQVDSSSTDKQEVSETQTVEKQELAQKETAQTAQTDTDKGVKGLTQDEILILQRIVEAEATGEDIKGKMLVANVILNRVNDDSFPDTIEGVVFQQDGDTYQFSPIKDKRYWSVNISQDTVTAVERVMQGEDDSQGALYFSARDKADKNSMSWFDRNLEFLFEYGGHEFFR
ncbi:MAG: cell wall hydrolase SleB [Anaerocolumna sp.]|jgi:N-acetylmuramoyl-L-alanine amidase|nr:cell wall hydrolase SleB [Anaerocolumna sp.]